MSTEESAPDHATGALLLCRAEPDAVAVVAGLLGEPMPLVRAGARWSVLVPEGRPWRDRGEPVDRVVTGWAAALAVGAPWPVLALWWDADRAGYTLASGFRRPVGYVWLANGTPVGEDEAMRTFAARLGLDPVLDLQALDRLTRPDPETGARARMRGLLAVLTRAGVSLPAGLDPGEPADRLRERARALPDARWTAGAVRGPGTARLAVRPPGAHGPAGRAVALAEVVAGAPLLAWGALHRSGGWTTAGALLAAHGTSLLIRTGTRAAPFA
ncbi:hypothetical protein ABZV76_18980 [Streptomyces tendae]|uniref:hypothetical protein n=1 Tax=Streptomyces tendae TaxID=1932 RepID=UPI0033B5FD1D